MSLRHKTVTGLIWTFSQQFGVQLISFFITIILARILKPAEFGLIAMLSVFIAVGTLLVDGGLSSSLIRTVNANQKDYSTVFIFNLLGSFLIYLVIYLSAPLIAEFYHQNQLTSILRVYAIVFILNAFYEIQNAHLMKNMNFKVQALIQMPSVLASGVLGIFLALNGYGVWSLVWMNIFQSLLITVFHWVYSSWRPSFLFDWESFHTHFHFGYKMTLSGLLDIIYRNIYVLIIGKNYSAAQLGYYSRAESVSQLPATNIATAVNRVTYPMFASISNDDKKLKLVYKKIMQQVIFWNASILMLMVVIAVPFFRFLLTDKWLPAVPYFKILCVSGILYPLHVYNLNILKVKGRSDLILKLEVFKKAISVVGILLVIPFGIYGLLYFQLFFSIVGCYINSYYSGKFIQYPIKEQLMDIMPIFLLGLLCSFLTYALDNYLLQEFQLTDFLRLIIDTVFFYTAFLGISYLIKLNPIHDIKQLILQI